VTAGGDGGGGGNSDDPEEVLEDALETVAHGAVVSVPSVVLQRVLALAFAAVLTNGFSANAYGLFAVARRLQRFLLRLALGFRRGLSRYLPVAETDAERDVTVTFAATLLLATATVFGAVLYLAAPRITAVAGNNVSFTMYLRVFALGLPASVGMFTAVGVLRGLEDVGALNLSLRIGFPVAQLAVAVVGVVLFDDLVVVAAGVMAAMGFVGLVAAWWLHRKHGVRLRWRAGVGGEGAASGAGEGAVKSAGEGAVKSAADVRRRFLRFSIPLFLATIATTTQRLGFYPIIAVYLSGTAGGLFAVGTLLGLLVRLPLIGINQFIPPVAASLHSGGRQEALLRLYQTTSHLVVTGVTFLAAVAIVFRRPIMALFDPAFVQYAWLLPGFVIAQFVACGAGSVGLLLMMTDNQKPYLAVNTVLTVIVLAATLWLTITYGLPGLVGGYLLMLTLNNTAEVVVLHHFAGLQPLTRQHAVPLVAAVPLAGVLLGVRALVPGVAGIVVGAVLGGAVYGAVVARIGVPAVERKLLGTLRARYEEQLRALW
jgi:O-antigen/teichoic acid export membrane protein